MLHFELETAKDENGKTYYIPLYYVCYEGKDCIPFVDKDEANSYVNLLLYLIDKQYFDKITALLKAFNDKKDAQKLRFLQMLVQLQIEKREDEEEEAKKLQVP